GGAAALNFIVKWIVARPRPASDLVHVERIVPGSTFPAGHVLNATAFLGFLCWLAWTRMPRGVLRLATCALLLAAIIGMGLSRVYFGEHWPSDVLGGYL